jgi:hypothetical protein
MNRPLTTAEEHLIRWMLEHGTPEAKAFLLQVEKAEVTPERCPCGCASINLSVQGWQGMHPIRCQYENRCFHSMADLQLSLSPANRVGFSLLPRT